MKIQGIDVSHWQGVIDFAKVKASGIDFVILKAGGSDSSTYKDKMFETNYKNAIKAGLNVGAYYFVGKNFVSLDDGVADAKRFVKLLEGKKFSMPVCLDLEATANKDRIGATEASIAFCDYLEKSDYYVSIYASDVSGFRDRLDLNKLTAYDKWVARYGVSPSYCEIYGMYQYSSTGEVNGITGNVDMNYAYKDYPSIMKKAHKNGY